MSQTGAPDHEHPHPDPHDPDHPHQDSQSPDHAHEHAEDATQAGRSSQMTDWTPREPTTTPTPLLYVDCFSGIAGDMLLGALLDAGLSVRTLEAGLAALDLSGFRLEIRTKQSYGIAGTKLHVRVDEAVQPERRLSDILVLLERSQLPPWVQTTAAAIFRRLAVAEAKIHGSTVDAVHFHEVGAVDSIVDIVGSLIGLHALGVTRVFASSLPLPGGTVRAQHGLLPAPAPATLEILAHVGAPTRPSPILGELVTPTGAAILAELATFEQPLMRVHRVGYGYGTKELPWPNAVRVWLGEGWLPAPPNLSPTGQRIRTPSPQDAPLSSPLPEDRGEIAVGDVVPSPSPVPETRNPKPSADEVVVIEANLDDMTPEQLGYAMERLLAAGALDVSFTAIQMKKNRPGTLLGVIARPEQASALAQTVLRETTTLGVRMHRAERLIAPRRQETVQTPFGPVRVKLKLLGERPVAAPEFEDCAALARAHGVPLADVYSAAQRVADMLDK